MKTSTLIDEGSRAAGQALLAQRAAAQQALDWGGVVQASFEPSAPSADSVQALLALGLPMMLGKGAQLLSREQPAQRHWLLLSGQVAMGVAESGRMRQQTREVLPGQWIDNASAWLGAEARYLEDAIVEKDAVVLSFAHADLLRCGRRHPALLGSCATALVTRLRDMLAAELSLIRQSAESRFASWLLQHAEAPTSPDAAGQVVLRQRKRAIASQLGATPETFSRVLRQLVSRGAVKVRGYTIDLLDLDLLRSLASAGAAGRAA